MMKDKQLPGISVLVCTYNGASRMMATLEYLSRQRILSAIDWEIVLVDNNSNDNTLLHCIAKWEHLGSPVPLRPLSQPKPGKQFALEMAYDAARYDLMCIVDDDNWLQEDYLERGYTIMRANLAIGLLGGSNEGAFEISPPAWFSEFQAMYAVGKPIVYLPGSKQTMVNGEVSTGVLWGAGLFVRYAIWERLKQLHFKSLFTGRQGTEQLTAGEDDELCSVARLLGYKLWYSEELNLIHYMTAGRLTEDYLKRLCYASPRAYPGLSAYQRVLATDGAKYTTLLPWIKDWLYMLNSLIKGLFSASYIKSIFKPRLETHITVMQRILILQTFTKHFALARNNYKQVLRMREKFNSVEPLHSSMLTHN